VRISGPTAYIALYSALYAGFGVASPFWPKFFETRTLVPQQIGLILAAAMVARLVSGPVVGMLADFLERLPCLIALLVQGFSLLPTALRGSLLSTRSTFMVVSGW